MRSVYALLALLIGCTSADGYIYLGGSSATGGGGVGLSITTASLNTCAVGSLCSQALTASGGSGGYTFSRVSEYPNTGLWDSITPSGVRTGTPQYAEYETVTYQVTDSSGNTARKTFTLSSAANGTLAIASPPSLPAATLNGAYSYRFIATGGLPPYRWSGNSVQPCNFTGGGWLICSPTSTGVTSFTVTVTDANGTSVTQSESFTSGSALTLGGIDPNDGIVHLPPALAGNTYSVTLRAYGGTPPYSFTATGLPAWFALNASTGVLSGTPTVSGNVESHITVTDNVSATSSSDALINVSSSGLVQRPAYNASSSNGYFVLGTKLYDPTGHPFTIRGENQLHYDSASPCCVRNTGANTLRIWDANLSVGTYLSLANTYLSEGIFPILTIAYVTGCCSDPTSNNTSVADLDTVTAWWVANEPSFASIMSQIAINIANEWGPPSSTWETAYESEIGKMRTAGYTCPILIDAPDAGQGISQILQYASAIEASDPLHNVIFSWHAYDSVWPNQAQVAQVIKGSSTVLVLQSNAPTHPFPNGWVTGYYVSGGQGLTSVNGAFPANTSLGGSPGAWTITLNVNSTSWSGDYVPNSATVVIDAAEFGDPRDIDFRYAAQRANELSIPLVIGEFGPGPSTGDDGFIDFQSSTTVEQLLSAVESYGLVGWIDWAIDDNHLPGGVSPWAGWWGHTLNGPGTYSVPTDLSAAGLDIILNPRYGYGALSH